MIPVWAGPEVELYNVELLGATSSPRVTCDPQSPTVCGGYTLELKVKMAKL